MTNIRTKGFDSPAQMREYLDEIDDASLAGRPGGNDAAMQRTIGELREQIAGLRRKLEEMRREEAQAHANRWLRMATTMTLTMTLGFLARRMKLGALGTLAVPLVVTRLNRKF